MDPVSPSREPERGFPQAEFEARTELAQELMRASRLDALLLTTEAEVRYFSGFHSQFWASPTRPWFLVLPAAGKPIAVVPDIGVPGMTATWLDDVRSWPAPRREDDGVTLLAQLLSELTRRYRRLGVPLGHQSHLRMPASDFAALLKLLAGTDIVDASGLMTTLRNIKSPAEIEKVAYVCDLASSSLASLTALLRDGESERELCRRVRVDLLERGADAVPYLVAASGPGGYGDIIIGPSRRRLMTGDLVCVDVGATFDGYFSDFNRNAAVSSIDDDAKRAYGVLFTATEAGFAAARPGARCLDLWAAMWAVLEAGGAPATDAGRLGHGLGMQLTEGPSLTPSEQTLLAPGMILTLEPAMSLGAGRQMVHEEVILITDDGARWLTRRAPPTLPITR